MRATGREGEVLFERLAVGQVLHAERRRAAFVPDAEGPPVVADVVVNATVEHDRRNVIGDETATGALLGREEEPIPGRNDPALPDVVEVACRLADSP